MLVDSDVVQLDDGRIGKLADDLGLAEELLFEAWTEIVQKGFECDDSADNVVARLVDAARGITGGKTGRPSALPGADPGAAGDLRSSLPPLAGTATAQCASAQAL